MNNMEKRHSNALTLWWHTLSTDCRPVTLSYSVHTSKKKKNHTLSLEQCVLYSSVFASECLSVCLLLFIWQWHGEKAVNNYFFFFFLSFSFFLVLSFLLFSFIISLCLWRLGIHDAGLACELERGPPSHAHILELRRPLVAPSEARRRGSRAL